MNIILLILIAISLSMDAFSFALVYGTVIKDKKSINLLSIIVGLYHFFMPIFGLYFGNLIINFINIEEKYVTLVVFFIIGINMILENFKEKTSIKKMKFLEMLLFGFAVSIDSFSVGLGINNISTNYFISSLIFSTMSMFFTYLGLILGNKIKRYFGKLSTVLGGLLLILLGIIFFIK